MTHILDPTTILRAIKDTATDTITDSHTLELARHEPGNIVWKQHTPFKTIDQQESLKLTTIIPDLLNTLNATDKEANILEPAKEINITIHDATHPHHAREQGLPLTSEDTKLNEKSETHRNHHTPPHRDPATPQKRTKPNKLTTAPPSDHPPAPTTHNHKPHSTTMMKDPPTPLKPQHTQRDHKDTNHNRRTKPHY